MSQEVTTRRERTRERLLDAALNVFGDVGLAQASIEMISEAAGFTRGAFYSNFSTKDELFLALTDRETARRIDAFEPAAATLSVSPVSEGNLNRAAIREIVTSIMSSDADERRWTLLNLEFELLALREPSVAQRYAEQQAQFITRISAALERVLEAFGLTFTVTAEVGARILANAYVGASRQALLAGATDFAATLDSESAWFAELIDRLIVPSVN